MENSDFFYMCEIFIDLLATAMFEFLPKIMEDYSAEKPEPFKRPLTIRSTSSDVYNIFLKDHRH